MYCIGVLLCIVHCKINQLGCACVPDFSCYNIEYIIYGRFVHKKGKLAKYGKRHGLPARLYVKQFPCPQPPFSMHLSVKWRGHILWCLVVVDGHIKTPLFKRCQELPGVMWF